MINMTVLITCYNRVAVTCKCVRKLLKVRKPESWDIDIWLVDDASPDHTGEIVKKEFPSVHVIEGTGILFWCKGMRLAWDVAASTYDYDAFLWLNDDVQLQDNVFDTLYL